MADRSIVYRLQADIAGFQAKMGQAAASTKKLAGDLTANTDQAEKYRQGLDHFGSTAGKVGLVAAAGLGAAVVASANFDQGMSKVQAATGETAANMDRLRDAAIDAGASTAFSATEAAAAIENLSKAGVSTSDILSGGLSGALDLAAAGELQVADAAEIAASALTQFNLAGADVPHVADLLAAGAGKAQGEVTDLAGALDQSGLVAAQMGLSLEETVGGLSAFASAGLLGSDAGTSFKTMLLNLVPQTEKAQGLFDDLGFSAFDAQGNFVGLEETAGRLRAALAGMTDEQRAATLKQMFGQDAIRAASILYEQGAEGIQDWIRKVDDSGYAADTAATKLDNLKGDVEAFTGALETALIGTGQGAQGPLRTLVQTGTAVVNIFNAMPGPLKTALSYFTAFTAVAGGGLWAGSKVIGWASSTREAISNLGVTADSTRSRMTKLGSVAGMAFSPWGAALTVAAGGLMYWAGKQAEAKGYVEELTASIDEQTGAFTDQSQEIAGKTLQDNGTLDFFESMGVSLDTVREAALGSKTALAELEALMPSREAIDASARNPMSGRFGTSASEIAEYIGNVREAAGLAEESGGNFQQLNDFVGDTGDAAGTASVDLASMRQQLLDAGFSAKDLDTAMAAASDGVGESGDAASDAAGEYDDLLTAMRGVREEAIRSSNAEIAYEAAMDDAAEAAKKNVRTLDITTEAGRANRTALNQLAGAWNGLEDSTQNVPGAYKRARRSIIDTAIAMGASETRAKRLADRMLEIPSKRTTDFKTKGADKAARDGKKVADAADRAGGKRNTEFGTKGAGKAQSDGKKTKSVFDNIPKRIFAMFGVRGDADARGRAKKVETAFEDVPIRKNIALRVTGDGEAINKARRVEKAIEDIPKQKVSALSVSGTEVAISKARNLKGAIDNLSSKTITVTTHYKTVGKPGGGGEGKAGGGLITGPGTGTSDSIPLMGSNGEFMVRTAAVNYYGVDMLNAINQMRYAQRGLVTPTGPPPVAPARTSGGSDVLLAEIRGLRTDVRRSARESGAEFGQRMNGILDDASRSTL